MGINTYGLFSQMQSDSAYSGRSYELRRQLGVRREQLDKLNSQDTLSDSQLKKRDQLQAAVDHLQGSLSKIEISDQITPGTSEASAKTASAAARRNPYNPEAVTYKNPGHYDGNATTPQDTYLKGFFVDLRL